MTKKTLYLLVTCCVEETRFNILKTVISNLKDEQAAKHCSIEHDLIVFDNGSTYPGTIELLKENFKTIYRSTTNQGFWSAINWVLNEIDISKYEYIYIIESDHTHFALEKLQDIEAFLDANPAVGGVRCQEFVVSLAHLYDKYNPVEGSRQYAWVNMINPTTRRKVTFDKTNTPDFYFTQLLSQLHSVNRLTAFKDVFKQLAARCVDGSRFSELDYQLMYSEHYPTFCVIDGGIFHAKLSWFNGSIAGSYCGPQAQETIGYQETRISRITPPKEMEVENI